MKPETAAAVGMDINGKRPVTRQIVARPLSLSLSGVPQQGGAPMGAVARNRTLNEVLSTPCTRMVIWLIKGQKEGGKGDRAARGEWLNT